MTIGPGSARESNRPRRPPRSATPHPSGHAGAPVTGFSVVVVLHESASVVGALLRSLGRWAGSAQVVVVDTASHDEGPRLASEAGAEVLELGENPGFGAACN